MRKISNLSHENILDYLVLLLFFGLPLHRNISTISIVLIFLISITVHVKQKSFPPYRIGWFLPALFFYYALSDWLTGGTWYDMEKRFLLIGIPILFWLNPNFYRPGLYTKISLAYVIGILSAELFCVVRAINYSLQWVNGKLIFNPKIFPDADYDFLTAAIRDGNYFFGEDFSYFMHPIYFGLYMVVAQFLIFELWKNAEKVYFKSLLVVLYFSQFFFLFLTSSKASIFSSIILALYFAFSFPKQRKARWVVAIVILVFSSLFISINPRMRLFTSIFESHITIDPNTRSAHGLRFLCWDASIDVIKKNWLFGVGEGQKDNFLNEKYVEKKYIIPARQNLNSHNQYLDLLLGGGLAALALYLSGIIGLVKRSFSTLNYPLLIFIFLFSFEALFENLLARHAGILLFSVFLIYFRGNLRAQL